MSLAELIAQEDLLEVHPQDKWKLLDYLSAYMADRGKFAEESLSGVQAAVIEREKSMSTGIGDGVALPHCSSNEVDKPALIMAICRSGMEFEAIDHQPVFFIILLVLPKNKFQTHINTLAEIARVMNNDEFRQGLLQCPSVHEMYQFIRKHS